MKTLQESLAFIVGISLFLSGVTPGSLRGQDNVIEKYSQVLDTVFPSHWKQCSVGFLFGSPQITIRILPSFSMESQVVICRIQSGQFIVVSSTLDPKDTSVWHHMMTMRQIDDRSSEQVPTTESAEEISAAIHVIHKSCKLDPRVADGWFRKLATVRMSLPQSGGGNDGITYEVTLQNGMDMMKASIWVAKQQKPLITLVESILRQIKAADCRVLTSLG